MPNRKESQKIIGSQALFRHNVVLDRHINIDRNKRDVDIITYDESLELNNVDSHVIPKHIFDMVVVDEDGYANPDMILTFKMSHLSWDIHWEKTKEDILGLLELGYECDLKLYSELKKHWLNIHGNKDFLSLKMDKSEFFNDFVEYVYDHDYLHTLVSHPNEPMYTKVLKDNEDVLIDRSKFESLSYEDKLTMFQEEITVIAIERWLINRKDISWLKAYNFALKKTITNLTKNWANDFIIHNLKYYAIPDFNKFFYAMKLLNLFNPYDKNPYLSLLLDEFNRINGYNMSFNEWLIMLSFTEDELLEYHKGDSSIFNTINMFNKFMSNHDYKIVKTDVSGCTGSNEFRRVVFFLNDQHFSLELMYKPYMGILIDGSLHTIKEVEPVRKEIMVFMKD